MTKELIHKYFTGTCSLEEEAEVMAYIQGDDLKLLNDYMDEIDRNSTDQNSISMAESDKLLQSIYGAVNTEEVIRHIQGELARDYAEEALSNEGIKKQTSQYSSERHPVKKGIFKLLPIRMAASVVLICSLITGGFLVWKNHQGITKSDNTTAVLTTVDNPSINIKKVKMLDGTMIWLNAHSSLTFNSDKYNTSKREVTINGEAYFDVAHNATKPFVVHLGEISTTVLGTAFNVEAYKNENHIKVILVRGKIKVETSKQQQLLTPGQMISYSVNTKNLSVKEIDTKDVSSWISGKIVFNDIPLKDAFKRMEQLFGIEIRFISTSDHDGKRLTGVFDRKSPDEILKQVLFVYGLHYTKKGGLYIIK